MLISFALTLSVLIAFCGLGIDVGLLAWKKVQLQNAADAAALGAMYSLQGGAAPAAWQAAAKADAALNGFTDGQNGVTVTAAQPTAGPYTGNALAVQVTITQAAVPFFLPGTQTLSAQATSMGANQTACSYFLSQYSTQPSVTYSLSTAQSTQNVCTVYLGRSYDIEVSTSSGLRYLVAGNRNASVNSLSTITPAAVFNAATTPDPLASVPPPSVVRCDHTGLYTVPNGTTPPAGTYCGGIQVELANNVTFSGTYNIVGNLNVDASTITGSNVTFHMTQFPGYQPGTANFNLSTVNLSAPTSGTWQGILFYSDRSLPPYTQSGKQELSFNATNGTLDGILYLPGQELYSSLSNFQTNRYLGAVADWFDLESGTMNFGSDYSTLSNGNPFQQAGGSGGLVE